METCTPPRVRVLAASTGSSLLELIAWIAPTSPAAGQRFFRPRNSLASSVPCRTLSACHDDSSARDSAHCEEMLSDSAHHEEIK